MALLLIETLRSVHALAHRARVPGWLVALVGGAVVALGACLTSDRYLGLGLPTLEAAVAGQAMPPDASLLKILFTARSLGTGGSGGIDARLARVRWRAFRRALGRLRRRP